MFRGYFDRYISTTQVGEMVLYGWPLYAVDLVIPEDRRAKLGRTDQIDAFSFAERNCSTSPVYIKCARVGYIKTGGYLHTRQNLLHRSVNSFAAIQIS